MLRWYVSLPRNLNLVFWDMLGPGDDKIQGCFHIISWFIFLSLKLYSIDKAAVCPDTHKIIKKTWKVVEEQNRKKWGTTREAICGSFELYVLLLTALQHGNQHDQKNDCPKEGFEGSEKIENKWFHWGAKPRRIYWNLTSEN